MSPFGSSETHCAAYPIRTVSLNNMQHDPKIMTTRSLLGGSTSTLAQTTPIFNGTVFGLESYSGRSRVICFNIPRVPVEGPALLEISIDDGKTFINGSAPESKGGYSSPRPSNAIEYYQLVDAALDRRPYISERFGHILLTSDTKSLAGVSLKVSATLKAGIDKMWTWDGIKGGRDISLPFELDSLPNGTIHNDILITISGPTKELEKGVTIQRRFHKVPPPTTGVQAVQIDHERRGILLGGEPWIGQGWYVEKVDDLNWHSVRELARVVQYQLVPKGINQALFYGLNRRSPQDQILFLDLMHEIGFKVMYDVNDKHPYDNNTAWDSFLKNITRVMDHPALLGYYICDDCCTNAHDISLQSQLYILLKNLDPYHITIGATNCGDTWMYTDAAPSYLPPESNINDRVLPEMRQPALQLSLDIVMQENYDDNLKDHAGDGTWPGGVSNDGKFRHGMSFSPLLNCPSPDVNTYKAPRFMLSASYLGLITGGMYSTLVYTYDEKMANEGWEVASQEGVFANQMEAMAPAITAPFTERHRHPSVTVFTQGAVARGWSVPDRNCSFIAVVNTEETSSKRVRLQVSSSIEGVSYSGINATRIFDSVYDAFISKDGVLEDDVDAGNTNVYSVGDCVNITA